MGLIDLQTDLKSLKYSTVPGNGTGPIIRKSIPEEQTSTIGYSIQNPFKGPGFFQAIDEDVKRVEGWFDQNRGSWAIKQSTLELFNPKTEVPLINRIPDVLGINAVVNTAGSPLGIHLHKNGIAGFISDRDKYETTVIENNNLEDPENSKNRLVELTNRFIYKNSTQPLSFLGPLSGFANSISEAVGGFFGKDDPILFSYVGGPGGPITTIRKASNQRNNGKNTFSTSFAKSDQSLDIKTLETSNTTENPFISENSFVNPYTEQRDESLSNQPQRKNIFPSAFGMSKTQFKPQPEARTRVEYNSLPNNPNSDRINLLKIGQTSRGLTEEDQQGFPFRDLIKFKFGVINNGAPSTVKSLQFRAYLTNISDNFNPSWDSVKYVGRGEEFYNYTGFSRNVSFNLAFAALTRQELIPLYNKINYLASLTAPDYTDNGYIRGNIVKLTIGDYIDAQPGVIDSLSYNIEDNVMWEINLEGDENIGQFPHVLRAQIGMKLIHNFLPKKGHNFIGVDGQYDPFQIPIIDKLKNNEPIDPSPTFDLNAPLGSEGTPSFNLPGYFK